MKNMAWLSLVSERLRYTKVSQSSGLPADNSELMSRSKFTRDIGGRERKQGHFGQKQRARGPSSRARDSPLPTNEPRARGRKAAEWKGPRGRSRAADIASWVSLDGLSCPPANVQSNSTDFPLKVCAKRGQKGHFFRARLGSCCRHTPPQFPQY